MHKAMKFWGVSYLVLAGLVATMPVTAQVVAPATPPLPVSQDIAYPGTLKVFVDATDLQQRVIRVRQVIPVTKAGPLTLIMPRWLPGKHAPRPQADKIANIRFLAGGQSVTWLRDPVEYTAFHITVPEGAKEVVAEFDFLSPMTTAAGRVVVTDVMMNLQWENLSMYPAGYYTKNIPTELTLKLPEGWEYAAALDTASKAADGTVTFKPLPYEHFIDSPMFAGKYKKTIDLSVDPKIPVRLNVFADKPGDLAATDEQVALHKKMVAQAVKVFKSQHYDHYDFLLHLSEEMGDIGLEHHRSSENGHEPKYFTDWNNEFVGRDLLAHEYTHSWDGKFRRGADLYNHDFHEPMRGSLLWVYEGQTQYWGYMLSARSGMYSQEQAKQAIAQIAALFDHYEGSKWRPVIDTTNDPVISARAPKNWVSQQRSEDYYNVGLLVWLDADTLIREKTNNKKSLDDFAGAFFGIKDGSFTPETYEFKDVVATLNSVYPYDWDSFLKKRIYETSEGSFLDGLERGGYKLVYTDKPTEWIRALEKKQKVVNLSYSLGLIVTTPTGEVSNVFWDSPAFKAGLGQGMTVVAVNGVAFDADGLKAAVAAAAKPNGAPVELLIKRGKTYTTVKIDYTGGLKYPRLEKIEGKKAYYLDDILAEKK
ncbi:M61 family metallopeptidase [Asticcacaulis sp. YBE204]|uniref:M61 family metallopeptidase n=1 Tax=Asticcacaulis sp. YBE204 TaxID=1282363 RepID=UPI0003C3B30B|nr:M61 family metallopeptidase [Asticcacaulis sp. YBE204]ESQ76542.1 peptidase M61 [Asticcacaulis sp. YBE204]